MDESQKRQDAELMQLVTFSIGEEEFGVDILKVQEIIRTMEITKVPRAPIFVEGVINLRGKVIPIIDLRRRFGLETRAHDKHTRIIVIEISNMIVGFVVDSVSEVLRIPASTVEPPPPVVAGMVSLVNSARIAAGKSPVGKCTVYMCVWNGYLYVLSITVCGTDVCCKQ